MHFLFSEDILTPTCQDFVMILLSFPNYATDLSPKVFIEIH